MPYPNQYALSLEVAQLLPLPINYEISERRMNFARDLANSGSDVAVEQYMVEIFGRSRIRPWLASGFKTVLGENSSSTALWQVITLQAGPGPTVERAFREAPYFAMVVQLSFLTWFFDAKHLAAALHKAMHARLEGASSPIVRGPPSESQILGLLRACERQTAAYNWNRLHDSVREALMIPESMNGILYGRLHGEILTGALDMFPMVQARPHDRLVWIRLPFDYGNWSALCPLIIWTHHILGLTVKVDQGRYRTNDHIFGDRHSRHVIISEVSREEQPSISLLDASKQCLLKIELHPLHNTSLVGPLNRIRVRGWGERFLLDSLKALDIDESEDRAMLRQLQILSCSFAQIVAAHLMRDGIWNPYSDEMPEIFHPTPYPTDPGKIRDVANELFNDAMITQFEVDYVSALYKDQALGKNLPITAALSAAANRCGIRNQQLDKDWEGFCSRMRHLSVFLIAFAHIQNLADLKELTFCNYGYKNIDEHELATQLRKWNGISPLYVGDATWLQAIAVLLLAHSQDVWELPWDRVCLVSDRGWSAWIPTSQTVDPEYTNVGDVFIRRGSPCMNGVWREGVWDIRSNQPCLNTYPEVADEPGESASLRCSEPVSFETPYCETEDKVFLIGARLRRTSLPRNESVVTIGFRGLHKALWCVPLSDSCTHGGLENNSEIVLPVNCVTVEGYGSSLHDVDEKVIACLTGRNLAARWLGVAAFQWTIIVSSRGMKRDHIGPCMLRRNSCCFRCAIEQGLLRTRPFFLIL